MFMKDKCFVKRILASVIATVIFFASGIGITARNALAYNSGIEAFVNSLYSDCLGRTADPAGFNDWCTKLANGTISGKECAYGFFFSPEFRAKAETMPAGGLVDTYYRVFLNRSADSAGKSYWMQRIAPTSVSDDIIILFNGFADSTEFAQKCASYGITVGSVNVPALSTAGAASGGASSAPATDTWTAVQNGSYHFGSSAEMDAYFANRGCVVYNIYIGEENGYQKVYVQFFDATPHAQMLNQHRVANGQSAIEMVTDPNDPRMIETRLRAVEAAYAFCHDEPGINADSLDEYNTMVQAGVTSWYSSVNYNARGSSANWVGENITSVACETPELTNQSFQNFVNSSAHNRNMLTSAYIYDDWGEAHPNYSSYAVASCRIWVVASDGVSINPNGCRENRTLNAYYTMPNGYGTATVQDFYGAIYLN